VGCKVDEKVQRDGSRLIGRKKDQLWAATKMKKYNMTAHGSDVDEKLKKYREMKKYHLTSPGSDILCIHSWKKVKRMIVPDSDVRHGTYMFNSIDSLLQAEYRKACPRRKAKARFLTIPKKTPQRKSNALGPRL
jgi:hypothetical protein